VNKWLLNISLLLTSVHFGFGQLQTHVDNPDSLVYRYFGGSGVTISNVTFTGFYQSIARFAGNGASLGLDSGIVLSTGLLVPINGLAQPAPYLSSSILFQPGDIDLDSVNTITTADAAILEFDFTPIGDTLKFEYVFASEEYPENVCNLFNDAFAFFISGPGIVGKKNIALVPGGADVVSVNSINGGVPYWPDSNCTSLSNTMYYVDNTLGTNIVFNGFTTALTAVTDVIPCQTYHLKIVIADGNGGNTDSGVFLKANSFHSDPISITPSVSYGGPDTLLYEDCGYATLVVQRTYNLQNSKSYTINYSGTATYGNDFSPSPLSVTMLPGQLYDTIQIVPLGDGIPDNAETLIITIGDTLCNGDYFVSSVELLIYEKTGLSVEIFPNSGGFCDSVRFTSSVTGAVSPFQYLWNPTGSSDTAITRFELGNQIITLNVSDACGQSITDTSIVTFGYPPYADFTFSPDYIDILHPTVYFQDQSSADVTDWNWSIGENGITLYEQSPEYIYTETDSHLVVLVVNNDIGCMDTSMQWVVIYEIPTLYIPNSFTPNGDHINDIFMVSGKEIAFFRLQILDRWGREVFSINDPQLGWDGLENGKLAAMGVYAVKVDFSLIKTPNLIQSFIQNLNVIR